MMNADSTPALPGEITRALSLTAQPKLEGWCTVEKASAMADLIVKVRPQTVVEIGVFGARSLVPQAMALRAIQGGTIYGIDPWKREAAVEGTNDPKNDDWWNKLDHHAIHKLATEAIWRFGLDDHAVLIRSTSHACFGLFQGGIDILHIDGNHSEEASTRDVALYVPLVRKGGYIWMDDCNWATTLRARQEIEKVATKISEVATEGQLCYLYRKQ
jgi:hypothetical protein